MPAVINGNLLSTPELIAQWNASSNATRWEGELWTEEPTGPNVATGACLGGQRQINFGLEPSEGLTYAAHVRPWLGTRPGAWGPTWTFTL